MVDKETLRKQYKGYWNRRQHQKYYQKIKEHIEECSPGKTILDVGCADTKVVLWGDFERRVTCDLMFDPELAGVESHVVDFMEFNPALTKKYDVVVCAQTLEHLKTDKVVDFAHKLLTFGRTVIVSVPYMWPQGLDKEHYQDPIDVFKLLRIMGRDPEKLEIVRDKRDRVVAVFRGIP